MIIGKMDNVPYVRAWVHRGGRDLSRESNVARQGGRHECHGVELVNCDGHSGFVVLE